MLTAVLIVGAFFVAGGLATFRRWLWWPTGAAVIALSMWPLLDGTYADSGHEAQATLGIAAVLAASTVLGRYGFFGDGLVDVAAATGG